MPPHSAGAFPPRRFIGVLPVPCPVRSAHAQKLPPRHRHRAARLRQLPAERGGLPRGRERQAGLRRSSDRWAGSRSHRLATARWDRNALSGACDVDRSRRLAARGQSAEATGPASRSCVAGLAEARILARHAGSTGARRRWPTAIRAALRRGTFSRIRLPRVRQARAHRRWPQATVRPALLARTVKGARHQPETVHWKSQLRDDTG